MNKKNLSKRDLCTEFITPALVKAGWDVQTQIREEVNLTKGKFIVSGKGHRRGESKRVEELLQWSDALEARLHQTRTRGAHLLAA